MPSLEELLGRLEEAKLRFGRKESSAVSTLLDALSRRKFTEADSLIQFHEILLFLRAYPQSREVVVRVERLLASFSRRVKQLSESGEDMYSFDLMEYAGIAGTVITGAFSYQVARWLSRRFPKSVSIDWEDYEKEDRLGQTLSRFLPLLDEESLVEANIPFNKWLHAAQKRTGQELDWLLRRLNALPLSEKERAETYDSLGLMLRWELDDSQATRTHARRRVRKIFFHRGPLIRRSEVSLAKQLSAPPVPLKPVARRSAGRAIDMLREAVTVRYRELYGITNGDPQSVVHANVGRGVEIFLWGLPPLVRLPLRAYLAGFTLKNGVPINYIEGITLFERMELGFNMFYTYREGESAWIYAQALRLLHQLSGATCFSVDPYQIGFHNEEAIESGAFWFYRKLGFRPTRKKLARLAEAEEKKIIGRPGYRSPARTLRKLSAGNVVYEIPGSPHGYWDDFSIRNLGLLVQRRMAKDFDGDPEKISRASKEQVGRALGINPSKWREPERRAFDNLALVLALIPNLARWTDKEKKAVASIIRAKAGADEMRYLRLLQHHARLRDAVRRLGSQSSKARDPQR